MGFSDSGVAYRLTKLLLAVSTALASQLATSATTRGFIALAVPPSTPSEANNTAIDLNGDGHAENQLGMVFSALASSGFDVSAAVNAGTVVYLLRVTSNDPAFQTDASARAEWFVGEPTAPTPPDFSGNGSFQADSAYMPGKFIAPLVGANFVSANPATTSTPVDVPLNLVLGNGFVVPLHGARLAFSVSSGGLMQGQINGSVRAADVQNIIVPSIANLLNQIVAVGGSTATMVLNLFDTGCNGVGANDGVIALCEVSGNSLLSPLLAADVDIYAEDGSYAPNPANTGKDSVSFGMLFSAANAQVLVDLIFADSFE
ncbi:MAG: hypothetical protein ABIW82_08010 [Dokdonella sp.]